MKRKQLFEKFLKGNLNNAYRFAYIYVKNKEDAEDIVSESVIKALKSINTLQNEGFLKTWFFTIIKNTAFNHLKRNQKVAAVKDEIFENYECHFDDYSNISFEDMIKNLSPVYKSIIVLRFFENMKIQDIAKVLELNENTVKTRLYKALEILKMDEKGDLL